MRRIAWPPRANGALRAVLSPAEGRQQGFGRRAWRTPAALLALAGLVARPRRRRYGVMLIGAVGAGRSPLLASIVRQEQLAWEAQRWHEGRA